MPKGARGVRPAVLVMAGHESPGGECPQGGLSAAAATLTACGSDRRSRSYPLRISLIPFQKALRLDQATGAPA